MGKKKATVMLDEALERVIEVSTCVGRVQSCKEALEKALQKMAASTDEAIWRKEGLQFQKTHDDLKKYYGGNWDSLCVSLIKKCEEVVKYCAENKKKHSKRKGLGKSLDTIAGKASDTKSIVSESRDVLTKFGPFVEKMADSRKLLDSALS
ncbi:MAG: hypothetical protein AAFR79_09770 [Pseudomonadota bacterium]